MIEEDATYSVPPQFDAGRIAQWFIILAITLALLIMGRGFLVPLAIALLLWNLINALAGAFKQVKIGSTTLPNWLAWSLAIATLLVICPIIYWVVSSQADDLAAAAPVYQANFARITTSFTHYLGIDKLPSISQFTSSINIGTVVSYVGGGLGSLVSEIILILLYVGFLLSEQRHFPNKLASLTSDKEKAEKWHSLMMDISKQVQAYLWLKTIVSLLTGLISYAILRWVGVDFAAVWALVIFLLNYIPTVGSAIGVAFPALLTLVQFEPLKPFILVVILLGATQFIIGNMVEPALMGNSLNLSPFVIILSLTFWGTIWGISGMVLCVPIMVIMAIICSHFQGLHWISVALSADGKAMKSP